MKKPNVTTEWGKQYLNAETQLLREDKMDN